MGVATVCRLPLEENTADGCVHGYVGYCWKRIPLMDRATVCRLTLVENTADGCGHGMKVTTLE